jgi:hypothetical protein
MILDDRNFSIDKNELKGEKNTKTNKNDEKIGIISLIGIIIYITHLETR